MREAFVKRPERPTYADLSREFNVNEPRIKVCAGEEGWASLRATYLEEKLRQCDAGEIVLSSIKVDGAMVSAFCDLGFMAITQLKSVLGDLGTGAISTRANIVNTCMFAMCNLAKALKDVGVIGIPKGLADGAQKDNGRWNAELLQQINVTVQNLTTEKATSLDPEV